MREVTQPKVFLVAEPRIISTQMLSYLAEVGGEAWFDRVFAGVDDVPDAEGLIEFAGRLCYKSWEPGLNANVTRVREDRGDYLLNILRVRHGSVLTHAVFSFAIHDGSRVFTAEMNRHAVGTAISEQSLRFVRLDQDIPFRLPHDVLKPLSCELMAEHVAATERLVQRIYEVEGIETAEDFAEKKTKTSAVRRIAPLGIATEELWSGNVRAIRHVISMRTARGAEEEIRVIADQIARVMCDRCPLLFGDYEQIAVEGAPPEWRTENWKV